jgi:hypothetical protein
MFRGDASGARLSDHVGYMVRYRLSWNPSPAPSAVQADFGNSVGLRVFGVD